MWTTLMERAGCLLAVMLAVALFTVVLVIRYMIRSQMSEQWWEERFRTMSKSVAGKVTRDTGRAMRAAYRKVHGEHVPESRR